MPTTPSGEVLDRSLMYCFAARAWGLKGWLGGVHSWIGFWSHEHGRWMVVELSDRETVSIQQASVFAAGTEDLFTMTPIVSDRDPRQMWFGAKARIVDRRPLSFGFRHASKVCQSYPFHQYRVLNINCNTFVSYLNYKMDLGFRRPALCVGFRSETWWRRALDVGEPQETYRRRWFPLMTATLLLALGVGLPAPAGNRTSSREEATALESYATEFGVAANVLERFDEASRLSERVDPDAANTSDACIPSNPKVGKSQRESLLACLANFGSAAWSESLFRRLFAWQEALRFSNWNEDVESNIALSNYLMDMTRSWISRRNPNQKTSWFSSDSGKFLNLSPEQKLEYPFEDGDLVLTFGGGGTSGLIGRLSSPVFRLSHAVIIRKRNGRVTTIESLPHTGTSEFGLESFLKENHRIIKVLRWRDAKARPKIAKKASDAAKDWADRSIPFDVTFSTTDESKIYCTALGAMAYAKAVEKPVSMLFPDQDVKQTEDLKNKAAHRVSRDIGTKIGGLAITPKTLARSSAFAVVAEFRDSRDMFHPWLVESAVDLTIDQYASGEEIRPDWLYRRLELVLAWPLVDRIPVLKKSQALSRLVGFQKFSILATLEKKIVEHTVQETMKRLRGKDLTNISLWHARRILSEEFSKLDEELFQPVSETTIIARDGLEESRD